MQGFHALIAMRRDEPHWLLNDPDAKVYGQALQNALRHIPIGVAQKSIDFAALAICAMNIETPRIYISVRNAKARRSSGSARPTAPTAVVYPFPSSPQPPAPSQQQQPTGAAPPGGAGPHPIGGEGFTGDGVDAPIGGV